jgi:SpoVK/Ycf46/Vps4 family AAA+-type ATPase
MSTEGSIPSMASADQVKALLSSLAEGEEAQFYSVAMQIAAHEARLGHGKLSEELRMLIDKLKANSRLPSRAPIPLARPRGEIAELLRVSYPDVKLSDMVLAQPIRRKLDRVIREHRAIRVIRGRGLAPRRKLLLIGKPGTGKTLTASALAGELGLPLFVVLLDTLITKFMGETAAKLRQIFEALAHTRGVYLFDEFDSIGSARGLTNDVGEIRRVVNSFLQMVEQDNSDSLVIAATNNVGILDRALFRRFDDVIEYVLPSPPQIIEVLKAKFANFRTEKIQWAKVAATAEGLSFADLARACEDAIKDAIIDERPSVTHSELMAAVRDRKTAVSQTIK